MKIIKLILLILSLSTPFVTFAQNSDIVYATGTGYSEISALKDAYRNAVSQKVATLITSSTIIRNEELIEDKIIAASGGFIDNMEVVSPATKSSNGLYTVKIKVKVLHDKIVKEMQGASHSKPVNIQAVIAKSENKVSDQEEMGKFLIKAIDQYMNTWKFEILDTRLNKNDDTSLIVKISGTLSQKDYINKFYIPFERNLNRMGIKKNDKSGGPYIMIYTDLTKKNSFKYYIKILERDEIENPFEDYVYKILKDEMYILRIEAKDDYNEVLATKDVFLKEINHRHNHHNLFEFNIYNNSITFHHLSCFPTKNSTPDDLSLRFWNETKAFNLNLAEDIKKVKSVSATVLRVGKQKLQDSWH